jgi:hypothetical protein
VKEPGRDYQSVPISAWNLRFDADAVRKYQDLGVVRVITTLPPAGRDKILPILDRCANVISQVR